MGFHKTLANHSVQSLYLFHAPGSISVEIDSVPCLFFLSIFVGSWLLKSHMACTWFFLLWTSIFSSRMFIATIDYRRVPEGRSIEIYVVIFGVSIWRATSLVSCSGGIWDVEIARQCERQTEEEWLALSHWEGNVIASGPQIQRSIWYDLIRWVKKEFLNYLPSLRSC